MKQKNGAENAHEPHINFRVVPFLAYKDLVKDKKIVILVIFLLSFSYVNLTFFPAFLNGLSDTFQAEIVDTATSHIIIQPRIDSSSPYINFESNVRNKINLIPGVVGSSSHIGISGTVFFEDESMGASITALTPTEDGIVTTISQKIEKGEFLSDTDTDQIILGRLIAGEQIEDKIGGGSGFGEVMEGLGGVRIGQKVKVRYSNGVEREYRVKGIVGSDGFSFVSQTVYITTKEAENVLGINDKASAILIKLNNKNDAPKYKKFIEDLALPNTDIKTWEEASSFTEGIKSTFGIVIFVTTIVAVIIVMATIGIVVFINTARKKRIIGVLKALGMQNSLILYVFLFESILFGVVGTIIGVAFVYATVGYLTINPIALPIGTLVPVLTTDSVVSAILIIIISSIVAGYVPARMASKQKILDTIKAVE
jgi:putative ABC transport system permease protein